MDLEKSAEVPADLAARYEYEAGRYWDLFYRRNADRFFRDRHYFEAEFPQLLAARAVLEVGCGAGNTVFPLLELNPMARLYACDFAPAAVALVRAHPEYRRAAAAGRLHAFVADITADDLTAHVPPASVCAVTAVFVLSALSPEAMPRAVRRIARTLRPGGQLLFRDYAAGDLAEGRLAAAGRQQRLGPSFYVRWDGTRAFYFSEDFLRRLFEREGFACDYVRLESRLHENRKRGARMDRRFLQAVFTYTGDGGGDGSSGSSSSSDGSSSGSSSGCEGRQAGSGSPACTGGGPLDAGGRRLRQAGQGPDQELLQLCLGMGGAILRLECTPPRQGAAEAAAAADRAAAEALAALVLACPAALQNADVLELCNWDAPLAALAALRWCRRSVAAGASEPALRLLRRNARLNGHLFVIERLRLQLLGWDADQQHDGERQGLGQQHAQLLRAFPGGFAVVLASVPAGADAGSLARLLNAAAALLSESGALLLLSVVEEAVAQQVAAAAAGAGLQQAAAAPAEVAAAVATAPPSVRLLSLERHL